MYAIIADGGRQYRVTTGQVLEVDYREAAKGSTIAFENVLCVASDHGVEVGSPAVDGASVAAEVLGVSRGPKLVVQKLRRRKNSRRRTGHRQLFTKVRIGAISGPSMAPPADPEPAPAEEAPPEPAETEAAATDDASSDE